MSSEEYDIYGDVVLCSTDLWYKDMIDLLKDGKKDLAISLLEQKKDIPKAKAAAIIETLGEAYKIFWKHEPQLTSNSIS